MMQQLPHAAPDPALVSDSDGHPAWYGRKLPADLPFLTRAGAWNAWQSRTLFPTFDLGEEIREADERRGRGWRVAGYIAFLCLLLAGATWAIWSGH